jgi:hypothetical protein
MNTTDEWNLKHSKPKSKIKIRDQNRIGYLRDYVEEQEIK